MLLAQPASSSTRSDGKKSPLKKSTKKEDPKKRKENLKHLSLQMRFASLSERKRAIQRLPYLESDEQKPFLPLLEKIASEDPDPSMREAAVHALGRLKAKASEKTLLAALKDKNANVVREAVWGLRKMKSRAAGKPLFEKLKKEDFKKHNQMLVSIIHYLGEIAYKDAAPFLLKKMKDYETHIETRKAIILFMGRARVETMRAELTTLMQDENSDLGSRAFAANALGYLGPSGIPPLKEELGKIEEIPDSKTRARHSKFKAQIVLSLLRLGEKSVGKYILAQARSDEPRIRIRAARTISRMKIKTGKEHLEYMAKYDPSSRVRKAAKTALENWGKKE